MVAKAEVLNADNFGVIEYDIEKAVIEKFKGYKSLTIAGIDDKEGYEAVHSARMEVRDVRLAVQKAEDGYVKALNTKKKEVKEKASDIYNKLTPIEKDLKDKEGVIDREKEKIKEEKERQEKERIDGIKAMIQTIRDHGTVQYGEASEALQQRISLVKAFSIDDKFEEFQEEARQAKDSVLNTLTDALEKRIQFEKEEAERKAESDRLKKVAEEQAKEKARQAEAQAKIDAENKRIEAEKAKLAEQKKQSRIDRLETIGLQYVEENNVFFFYELKYDAFDLFKMGDSNFNEEIRVIINLVEARRTRLIKEKEEREEQERLAKEKADREAKERAEAEKKRQEALKPDKVKLSTWISAWEIIKDDPPEMNTERGEAFLNELLQDVDDFITDTLDRVKEL